MTAKLSGKSSQCKVRLKQSAALVSVPQSRAEANQFIHKIGDLQRERARIEAAMNDRLAQVKSEFSGQAEGLGHEIAAFMEGIRIWAEANRLALTEKGEKKTVKLAAGEISWRNRPPKVSLRNIASVLASCKSLGLLQFVRIREEPDKAAMLANPDQAAAIAGVKIASMGEDFIIKPFETGLEQTTDPSAGSKASRSTKAGRND